MPRAKQIAPTGVRIEADLKERIAASGAASGRKLQAEILFALRQQYPVISNLQEGLRYGKVWGTRLLEMGPEAAAKHPNRRVVRNIYDQCEKHGPRFRWEMVGGRPDDLDDTLAEWERMEDA